MKSNFLKNIYNTISQRVSEAIEEQLKSRNQNITPKMKRALKRKGIKKYFKMMHIKHFGNFRPIKPWQY